MPGNLVVYRVGDGSAPLNDPFQRTQPVFLLEVDSTTGFFTPFSVALPTTAAGSQHRLTASGFDSEGLMTRSADGQYLVLSGYDRAVGSSSTTNTAASAVNRVIGRVDSEGNVDTSTVITSSAFDQKEIRGVASLDGSQFWVTGSVAGVHLVDFQSTGTSLEIATADKGTGRAVHIHDGQLYVGFNTSAPSTQRLAAVGVGTPTTAGQPLAFLPGFPSSGAIQPYQFFLADLSQTVPGVDTLYLGDDAQGIRKFSLVGGVWVTNSTVPAAGAGLRGLIGEVNGTSVSLYAVTDELHDNRIVTYVDTSGYNGTVVGNMLTLQSAGGNRAFRGIALAPIEAPPPPPPPPPADVDAVVDAGSGDNEIVVELVAGAVVVTVDGSGALNQPLAELSSLTINAGDGDDTVTLHESLGPEFDSELIVHGGSGQNALLVVAAGSGSTMTITESTFEGLTGFASGPDMSYHDIDVLEVIGTDSDDDFDIQLNGGSDLGVVTVNAGEGNDQFLLDLNTDPAEADNAVPGLVRVTLYGNGGGDSFGATGDGTLGKIQPSTTTAIVMDGGEAVSATALAPANNATNGNELGAGLDAVRLDLTDRRPPALADASVAIVSTVGGAATVTGFLPIEFSGIESIELCDQDGLTGVEMGDLYVRGTEGNDVIQFSAASSPTLARARINALGAYLEVTRKTVVYGRGGNDMLVQGNLNRPAEFHGEGGDDYLAGYQGNDRLVGGLGNDRIYGAGGDNELWGDNFDEQDLPIGGNDYLYGGAGEDIVYGGGGHDQASVGLGDDYVFGGPGNDLISGGSGDDRLYGGEGNDTISADDGNDILAGGEGADRLYGRGGNDLVIGGFGADILSGDAGNDLLIAGQVSTSLGVSGSDASTSANDAHDQAMQALLADWTLDRLLALALTFTHDGDKDSLSGGTGSDAAAGGPSDIGDWETWLP